MLISRIAAATLLLTGGVAADAAAFLISFDGGTATVTGGTTTPGSNFSDSYTFTTGTGDFFSGSLTTHRLVDPTNASNVYEDLNFTGASLVDITNATLATGTTVATYAAPGAAPDETINIPSIGVLSGHTYSLLVNYDAPYASNSNKASFSGPLYLASSDVPEPATWAMMIGGFGMMGAALRRQHIAAFA